MIPLKTEEQRNEFLSVCERVKTQLSSKGLHGPWEQEPHFFDTTIHGYPCKAIRNPVLFNWCGYVGIPKSHPLFEVEDSQLNGRLLVHGGVTYNATIEDLYFIGFDCGHWNDLIPMLADMFTQNVPYRTLSFVLDELEDLALQLKGYEMVSQS